MTRDATVEDVLAGNARWCVVEGDARDVTAALPRGVVDALVTDPPSGIAFMGADWDRDKGGRAAWVAWLSEILTHARAAVRDGGRAFVWSLPRTSHWTGCAVEDAGWSIETTVQHLFGTGWPKGKGQLKPAAETWWLARNGRSEPLNVDACRVGTTEIRAAENGGSKGNGGVLGDSEKYLSTPHDAGRYPPNVVFSHAPGCTRAGVRKVRSESGSPVIVRGASTGVGVGYGGTAKGNTGRGHHDADGTEIVDAWECVEGCPVRELDEQSGELTSNAITKPVERGLGYGGGAGSILAPRGVDTGTASRFFPQFPADPAVFRYVAKPATAEKEEGVGGDAVVASVGNTDAAGRDPTNPRNYASSSQRVRVVAGLPATEPRVNTHPTVKSVALMRWLVDLVAPAGGLVLDPFGGSGTTGVACLASGRRVILVEREARYAEIARQRLEHWGAEWEAPVRASSRRDRPAVEAPRQGSLFGGVR